MYSFTSGNAVKAYRYYRCKGCKSICKAETLEEAVLSRLKEMMKKEDFVNKMLAYLSPFNSVSINRNHIELHNKEFERTQKLLDKYILLMGNEAFFDSEVMIAKIKMLELRLKELQSLRSNIDTSGENNIFSKNTSENYFEAIHQILNQDDVNKKKVIIDTFVKGITLSSNKAFKDISFNMDNS